MNTNPPVTLLLAGIHGPPVAGGTIRPTPLEVQTRKPVWLGVGQTAGQSQPASGVGPPFITTFLV